MITPDELAQHTVLLATRQAPSQSPQMDAMLYAESICIPRDRFSFEVFCLRVFALTTANSAALCREYLHEQYWAALYRYIPSGYDPAVVYARCKRYSEAILVSDTGIEHTSTGEIIGNVFASILFPGAYDSKLTGYGALECRSHHYLQRHSMSTQQVCAVRPMSHLTEIVAQTTKSALLAFAAANWRKYLSVLMCIAGLLSGMMIEWPYAFYVVLRLAICAASLYWASQAQKNGQVTWMWALGANAILFNPVVPVRMERSDWQIVDLADAVFLATWVIASMYHDQMVRRSKEADPS